jgi:hypothetical protein
MHHKMLTLVAGAAISASILAPDMASTCYGGGFRGGGFHGAAICRWRGGPIRWRGIAGWRSGWGWNSGSALRLERGASPGLLLMLQTRPLGAP